MIECLVLFGAQRLYAIGGDDLVCEEVGKAFDQVCVRQLVYKVHKNLKLSVPRETGNIPILVSCAVGVRGTRARSGHDGQLSSQKEGRSRCLCSLSRALSFPNSGSCIQACIRGVRPPCLLVLFLPLPLQYFSLLFRIGVFAKIPVLNITVPDYSDQVIQSTICDDFLHEHVHYAQSTVCRVETRRSQDFE